MFETVADVIMMKKLHKVVSQKRVLGHWSTSDSMVIVELIV